MPDARPDLPLQLQIRQVMAKSLKIKAEDIPESPRRGDFEPWDSLGHLLLVDALEAHFNVTLTPEEALSLDTLLAIEKLVSQASP